MTLPKHPCWADGCDKSVPTHKLMCWSHWKLVPPSLQRDVNFYWFNAPGTSGYLKARQKAIDAVAAALAPKPPSRQQELFADLAPTPPKAPQFAQLDLFSMPAKEDAPCTPTAAPTAIASSPVALPAPKSSSAEPRLRVRVELSDGGALFVHQGRYGHFGVFSFPCEHQLPADEIAALAQHPRVRLEVLDEPRDVAERTLAPSRDEGAAAGEALEGGAAAGLPAACGAPPEDLSGELAGPRGERALVALEERAPGGSPSISPPADGALDVVGGAGSAAEEPSAADASPRGAEPRGDAAERSHPSAPTTEGDEEEKAGAPGCGGASLLSCGFFGGCTGQRVAWRDVGLQLEAIGWVEHCVYCGARCDSGFTHDLHLCPEERLSPSFFRERLLRYLPFEARKIARWKKLDNASLRLLAVASQTTPDRVLLDALKALAAREVPTVEGAIALAQERNALCPPLKKNSKPTSALQSSAPPERL